MDEGECFHSLHCSTDDTVNRKDSVHRISRAGVRCWTLVAFREGLKAVLCRIQECSRDGGRMVVVKRVPSIGLVLNMNPTGFNILLDIFCTIMLYGHKAS